AGFVFFYFAGDHDGAEIIDAVDALKVAFQKFTFGVDEFYGGFVCGEPGGCDAAGLPGRGAEIFHAVFSAVWDAAVDNGKGGPAFNEVLETSFNGYGLAVFCRLPGHGYANLVGRGVALYDQGFQLG